MLMSGCIYLFVSCFIVDLHVTFCRTWMVAHDRHDFNGCDVPVLQILK